MVNSWNNQREKIFNLIKKISDYYGGDDPAFLEEYCKSIVEENKHDLDLPLNGLLEMEKEIDR